MADNTFQFQIITPESVLFSGDVDSVVAPGENGEFQILAEHTPFLTALTIGPVIINIGTQKTLVSISGGFCEVMPEKTVIIAHTAEKADKIDTERARAAEERARERLESNSEDIDTERANASLMRSLNRIEVAGMS